MDEKNSTLQVLIANERDDRLDLISATVANAMTAAIIIVAMSFGLIIPKLIIDYQSEKWKSARP